MGEILRSCWLLSRNNVLISWTDFCHTTQIGEALQARGGQNFTQFPKRSIIYPLNKTKLRPPQIEWTTARSACIIVNGKLPSDCPSILTSRVWSRRLYPTAGRQTRLIRNKRRHFMWNYHGIVWCSLAIKLPLDVQGSRPYSMKFIIVILVLCMALIAADGRLWTFHKYSLWISAHSWQSAESFENMFFKNMIRSW